MTKQMTEEEMIREAKNAYARDYAKKNRKKIRAYQEKWRKENPEKVKANNRNYWLRKAGELQAK